ncbi:MAG: DUF2933 domain-containing protein [Nitrospirae bacterium]|nr:DUF2933 domain-containing protein [Nitrospirota bacterium]
MDWLRENWFSALVFILFIAMHLFGHGMHGGHGGHSEEEGTGHAGHGEGQSGKKEKKGGHGCC